MKESSTADYLRGERISRHDSPVSNVYAAGDKRIVVHKDGTTTDLTKRQLRNEFNKVLSANQRQEMQRTLRERKDGTATVKIGGKEKGETKHYKTTAAAKAALTRAYGPG